MNVKPGDKQRGLDLFVGSPGRRTDKKLCGGTVTVDVHRLKRHALACCIAAFSRVTVCLNSKYRDWMRCSSGILTYRIISMSILANAPLQPQWIKWGQQKVVVVFKIQILCFCKTALPQNCENQTREFYVSLKYWLRVFTADNKSPGMCW